MEVTLSNLFVLFAGNILLSDPGQFPYRPKDIPLQIHDSIIIPPSRRR